jgi:DNA-3-methyladenine glycosylase
LTARLKSCGGADDAQKRCAMPEPLAPELFRSRGTPALARSLLGKLLVRVSPDGVVHRHRIVEVEAYHGGADRACHANRGKTARTSVMFEPGGVWYVYLCYGMHEMLNLVTGPAEFPAAVLIRGVEGISGPGRVTKALAVGRALNGAAAAPASGSTGGRRAARAACPDTRDPAHRCRLRGAGVGGEAVAVFLRSVGARGQAGPASGSVW